MDRLGKAAVPSPRTVEELAECFIVRDAAGPALAHVYFEEEPGRRAAAKLPTRDETRRIAANIAKMPERQAGARCKTRLDCYGAAVGQSIGVNGLTAHDERRDDDANGIRHDLA